MHMIMKIVTTEFNELMNEGSNDRYSEVYETTEKL